MMHDPRLADFLFIVLVGLLIRGILWLVNRSHAGGRRSDEDRPSS